MQRLIGFLISVLGGERAFQANVARVASGAALGQFIALVSLPILSRLFFPEDFALLSYYTAIHAIIMSFATARFDWIAPNAANADDAARVLWTAFLTMITICVFLLVASVLCWDFILQYLPQSSASPALILALLFLSVFLGSIRTLLYSWLVFNGVLKAYALSLFLQTLVITAFSILGGFLIAPYFGISGGLILIIAFNFGIATGCLTMMLKSDAGQIRALFSADIVGLWSVFQTNFKLALTSTAVSILNSVSQNIHVFVIAHLFGATVLGLFALATRIAFAPISFFTTAIANSFWAEAIRLVKSDVKALRKFYIGSLLRLLLLATAIIAALLVASIVLDDILGKEKWAGAGFTVVAITPFVFANIVFGPTNHLTVYDKQKYQLYTDLFALAFSSLTMFVMNNFGFSPFICIFFGMMVSAIGLVLRSLMHFKANNDYVPDETSK